MASNPSQAARPAPANLAELEDRLSEPTPGVVAALASVPGDILLLGVAGKMGPSLARMLHRGSVAAGVQRRIIGVARFSAGHVKDELESEGIETIRCDLLDQEAVRRLPDAPNVFYLAGMKFGSVGREALTWAMNTYLPAVICKRFPGSRMVALSTGNVYGLRAVDTGGSVESSPLEPVGEYAMSCLGRERMFQYFSTGLRMPAVLIRLNYACDLRYGVMVDLAQRVWHQQAVDLGMGYFNTIWQGDANVMIVQALTRTSRPPAILNVTGPETLSIRQTCEQLGRIMGRTPRFSSQESGTALLSDARLAIDWFGPPRLTAQALLAWVAEWVMKGGATLNKPTHFEARDGKF